MRPSLQISPHLHSRAMIKLTRYQWTVFFAAWLGWGFDVFDGLLFNYVAPNAVPDLVRHADRRRREARAALPYWTGILNSIFLLGWAAGGVVFGPICDRFGRKRVLLITMLMYARRHRLLRLRHRHLAAHRSAAIIASLGIGGEWAAGSAMVAEVVPEESRVEAGALLYTSAPFGLFLATFINAEVAGGWFAHDPATSWRYVLLFGLLPAAAAFVVRMFVKEPERWTAVAATAAPARLREIFAPELLPRTRSALIVTLDGADHLVELQRRSSSRWPTRSPARRPWLAASIRRPRPRSSRRGSRSRPTASTWAACSARCSRFRSPSASAGARCTRCTSSPRRAALFATFGLDMPAETRLYLYFLIGLAIFGVFGSFTFYLPELFPTRLRSTGAGFCYNIGRVVTAGGVFAVGAVDRGRQGRSRIFLRTHLHDRRSCPLIALFCMRWVIETRGQTMPD